MADPVQTPAPEGSAPSETPTQEGRGPRTRRAERTNTELFDPASEFSPEDLIEEGWEEAAPEVRSFEPVSARTGPAETTSYQAGLDASRHSYELDAAERFAITLAKYWLWLQQFNRDMAEAEARAQAAEKAAKDAEQQEKDKDKARELRAKADAERKEVDKLVAQAQEKMRELQQGGLIRNAASELHGRILSGNPPSATGIREVSMNLGRLMRTIQEMDPNDPNCAAIKEEGMRAIRELQQDMQRTLSARGPDDRNRTGPDQPDFG